MSVVLNLFLLKYGGTTAVAAFSIVMYVDSIIGMLTFGICDSLQPAISYCYGAGLLERMKAIFKRVVISFSYLVAWIDMCFSSFFTALDCPGRSLVVSFFGTLIFPIAFLVILSGIWGLNGVWLTASASAIASGILTLMLVKTLRIDR